MSTAHFSSLERMYLKAPINQFYQPTIHIEDAKATISITISPQMHHSARGVHGSVYFKLLDDAAFFAANAIETAVFVLTSDFHIRLLRPITEGRLTAEGWVTHAGRRNILASANLYDSNRQLIATGQGSFARSRIPLTPECGYE